MITVAMQSVSKMFGGHLIFEDLSLEIKEGETVGLVGPNGCGKTTIFKLIAGLEDVDNGAIHLKKGTNVGYLAQIPEYQEDKTVQEVLELAFDEVKNIEVEMKKLEQEMATSNDAILDRILIQYGALQEQFTRLGGYEADAEIKAVANGLSLSALLNNSFALLSGGEKTKVSLGLLLLQKPELLLLDEPTNHLDVSAIEWLEQYIKHYSGTTIVISHDRYFLDEVVTSVYELEDGIIQMYEKHNYSEYVKAKEQSLLEEFAAYKEQQKVIKKMKEAIRRLRQWAHEGDNEKFYKKANSMQKALDRMEKIKRPILERNAINLQFDMTDRSGKDVFVFKDVCKSYDNKQLFNNVSFVVWHKDRVAIVGNNGTGKSTLLKMISESVKADSGYAHVGSNVKIGYLSQTSPFTDESQTIIDAFRDEVYVTEGEARQILAKFLFYGGTVFKKTSGLSGGERMRLRLAQLMYQDINTLVLDEPTNHLDIQSREVLEEALNEFDGTIFAVSHDRYFLNKLFTRILWLENESVVEYIGNYDEAKLKKIQLTNEQPTRQRVEIQQTKTQNNHQKQRTNRQCSQDNIEKQIEDLELKIEKIAEDMLNMQNLQILVELQAKKENLTKECEDLYRKLVEA
ncbi:ABC transporter ATP-binding protein [Bacillus sp. HMF5848]|uniref:ribosomal protection-like ABC-F family protein n=1 Tax=Bacillus sp. HMF5848 TaxID=2495421 RepID=UPI000F7A52E5|nr:ABC-F family ATP-binding cassette domain-containing protein [Bacillus sp. HMF5848]RSK27934.1 ABC transporter ATP-binding protein [Bacillus sp. HMF5848]